MSAAAPSTFQPVVLFTGPEEGEKEAAVTDLLQGARQHFGEVEEHRFFAFETGLDHVVSLLRNDSLFGAFTAVRLRAAEHIKGKDAVEQLRLYLKHPNPNALLVLESNEVSVDRALESAVGAKYKRVFWEMFDNQKHGWLRAYFTRRGTRVEDEAIDLLLDLVDNTTADMKIAADRLITFVGNRITAADVERFIYHAKEENVFSLFDAVLAKNLERAVDIANQLLVGSDAMQIVMALQWQIDQIANYRHAREAGASDPDVFRILKVNSKRVQARLQRAAREFSVEQCRAMFSACVHCDAALRSLATPLHHGLIHLLLYSLIARAGVFRIPFGR